MPRTDESVVVIGGGFAGLAAAATAADGGAQVVLLESGSLGGRARTQHHEGYALNQGAHALYAAGPGAAVLGSLGIDPPGGAPDAVGGSGLWGEAIHPLPGSAARLATSRVLSVRAKVQLARLLTGIAKIDTGALAGVTVDEWLASLRLRPDAEAVVRMLTRTASYTTRFDRLSADAAARQVQLAMASGVRYVHGGWSTIVDALTDVARGRGVEIREHAPVRGIACDGGGFTVALDDGALGARALVLAAGSPERTRSLLPTDPGWGALGPDATAACLDLGIIGAADPAILLGIDEPLYLIQHDPPAHLAPAGRGVVHAVRYEARDREADRADLERHAARAGLTPDRIEVSRFLPHMTVMHALPTPERGGLRGRPTVDASGTPGILLAGDWVGPEGMLSDASLVSGAAAGRRAAEHVQRVAA